MITLRPYQQQAVDSVYAYLRDHDDNPVVVVPTGGGKTPIMATICNDAVNLWDGRIVILAHVKELLEQTYNTLTTIAPKLNIGIYSAGLNRKDMNYRVTIAGIQSIYRHGCRFDPFDLIIIDEAHMLPPEGDGMYRTFLDDCHIINPKVRLIGLTATAFRMTTGFICQPDHFLNSVCYEVGVKELIRDGYLCPLRTKASSNQINTDSIHIRGGEFINSELEELMDTDSHVVSACKEIVEYTQDRKKVLIFASGIKHGKHIQKILQDVYKLRCGFVSGESPDGWRKKMIDDFKNGDLQYLCNVNVLTTGFDAPNIDCIAMLRPTMSPGLYYQMVGRSFRIHPDKLDALILDFGGNVLRHGPVDALRITTPSKGNGDAPAKQCPECNEIIHAAYTICPNCKFEFPPPDRAKHDSTASDESILSGKLTLEEYRVEEVLYSVHKKKGAPADAPRTMRVQYRVGFADYISEWVCIEHSGYAHQKALAWWQKRTSAPIPQMAAEAVAIADRGQLKEPMKITVRMVSGERFPNIVNYEFEKPEADGWSYDDSDCEYVPADDDIPF